MAHRSAARLRHRLTLERQLSQDQRPRRSAEKRLAVHRSASVLLWAPIFLAAAAAAYSETAYVPNEGSGTVTVIDTATDQPTALIPKQGSMGKKLRGVALDSQGRTLFVVDAIGNVVLVVDTASATVRKTLTNINSAEGIQLSPDGKWVTACAETQNQAVFIDVARLAEAFRVRIQGNNPEHCVWSADGKWLLTSNENSHSVDVIDVAARKSVREIKTAGAPRGMGFLPDGSAVYVADETSGNVDVIATSSWSIIKSIPIGVRPAGLIVRQDGKRVYASAGGSGTVSVIDPHTNAIIATVKVGERPWNMALTRDGAKLYVANGRTNNVSVIDTSTNQVVHTIGVGERPWGVAIR
jgi:YVTN family beta-propeller protein